MATTVFTKLGLSYNITDAIKAKAYTLIAPDNYDIYGGKVNLDSKINDIGFGEYRSLYGN